MTPPFCGVCELVDGEVLLLEVLLFVELLPQPVTTSARPAETVASAKMGLRFLTSLFPPFSIQSSQPRLPFTEPLARLPTLCP